MTKQLAISQGYFATVDDEDYARLSQFKWNAEIRKRKSGQIYVYASRRCGRRNIYMHHEVLQTSPKILKQSLLLVDHENCDGLVNTKQNLRLLSASQNTENQKIPPRWIYVYRLERLNRYICQVRNFKAKRNIEYVGSYLSYSDAESAGLMLLTQRGLMG